MLFSDIPGHEDIKKTLYKSLERNAIAHAQLFHGNEGGGALALALAYTRFILCENRSPEDACNTCASCQKMDKHIHPDVHYFFPKSSAKNDAATQGALLKRWREFLQSHPYGNLERWQQFAEINDKAVQIHKEEAKNIIKTVSLKSFEGKHKILLIWYPETMNIAASNAILKVLEEPPEKTIYLLVSYGLEDIITTITSRTQLVAVPPFNEAQVAGYLQQKGIDATEAAKVSRISEGSLVKAEALLEHGQELAYGDFQAWMRSCLRADFQDLATRSEQFSQSGKGNQFSQLKFALNILRESIVSLCDTTELNHTMGEELNFIKKFGQAAKLSALEAMYEKLNEAVYHLERNANPRITHLSLSIDFVRLLNAR